MNAVRMFKCDTTPYDRFNYNKEINVTIRDRRIGQVQERPAGKYSRGGEKVIY